MNDPNRSKASAGLALRVFKADKPSDHDNRVDLHFTRLEIEKRLQKANTTALYYYKILTSKK